MSGQEHSVRFISLVRHAVGRRDIVIAPAASSLLFAGHIHLFSAIVW